MGHRQSNRGKRIPPSRPYDSGTFENALIMFAKAPIPGEVKTRLCPPLTPDEAATLHGSFVLDEAERNRKAVKSGRVRLDRFVACAPTPDHTFFKVLSARYDFLVLPQVGHDLGARMGHAFSALFQRGYKRIVAVGTDIPELPGNIYQRALEGLEHHELVLGPAHDGGYYLLGLTKPAPQLFTDMPWSTDRVASLTLQRAEHLNLSRTCLPSMTDIDRIEDLLQLIRKSLHATGHTIEVSQRTGGVLRTLANRLRSRGISM